MNLKGEVEATRIEENFYSFNQVNTHFKQKLELSIT